MTNYEIITTTAITEGIFTKEEARPYLEEGLRLPIHTFQEWHNLGYMVKKGEKAKMTCKIWKYSSKNVHTDDSTEEEQKPQGHYYLTNAYFFTKEQVQKIPEEALKNETKSIV